MYLVSYIEVTQFLKVVVPAVLVCGIAYFVIKNTIQFEIAKLLTVSKQDRSNTFSNLKLQAYERMILFLERIRLNRLVKDYVNDQWGHQLVKIAMIESIEKEFEHNLTQQIYISPQAWTIIQVCKEEMIQLLQFTASDTSITSSKMYAEALITQLQAKGSQPTDKAILFLKNEISLYFN